MEKAHILFVDDELHNLTAFKSAFRRNYHVHLANSALEGTEILKKEPIQLIITDQRMPDVTGVEFLEKINADHPDAIRMILTGFSDVEAIIDAINKGQVYRYITKPWDKNELKITIDNALEAFALREENKNLINNLKLANQNLEKKVQQRTQEIENLLFNILPEPIAIELRENDYAIPKNYDQVSVLFTDFKGFTQIAERMNPEELLEELDHCFLAFDEICERNNLEKIKTIGDAYMAAGGIPAANTTNAIDAVNAALEIGEFMRQWQAEKETKGETAWEVRIGIHTGRVTAGVVGKKRLAYDIWGDAVNLASRMESSGAAGKINISETTYQLVKDSFECEHRGKVSAKNKGEVDMYFVRGRL